jgi:hypothetical protein
MRIYGGLGTVLNDSDGKRSADEFNGGSKKRKPASWAHPQGRVLKSRE